MQERAKRKRKRRRGAVVDCQDGPATTVVLGTVSHQRATFYGFIYALVMQFMFELLAEGNAKSRKFPHWWTFCSLLWRSLSLTKGLSTWSDLMCSCVDLSVTLSHSTALCGSHQKCKVDVVGPSDET